MTFDQVLQGIKEGKLASVTYNKENRQLTTLNVRYDEGKNTLEKFVGDEWITFTDLEEYVFLDTWAFVAITNISDITLQYITLTQQWDLYVAQVAGPSSKSSIFRSFANGIGFTNG